VPHRASVERHTEHPVRLAPDSRLAALLGAGVVTVASWHHQAVDRLGDGLRAVAWADDGTWRRSRLTDARPCGPCNGTPSSQVAEPDGRQRRLFEALVDAAGKPLRR